LPARRIKRSFSAIQRGLILRKRGVGLLMFLRRAGSRRGEVTEAARVLLRESEPGARRRNCGLLLRYDRFFGTFDQLALGGLLAVFAPKLREAIGVTYLPPLRWVGLIGIALVCATTDATVDPTWVSLVALSAAFYIVGSPDTQAACVYRKAYSS
jgi:hypothetical protein